MASAQSLSKTVCEAFVPRAWSRATRQGTGSPGSPSAAAVISGVTPRSSSARAGDSQPRATSSSALTRRASGSWGAAKRQSSNHSPRDLAKAASRVT